MGQQKIMVACVTATSEKESREFELPELNRNLNEGYNVKSWQVNESQVSDNVVITVLLEKIEHKTVPGIKFGSENK